MAGKLQVFSLFASLFLYILDLGTDMYVAIQHKENGDIWYYRLTVGFVVLSTIVVNFFATYALKSLKVHWSLRALAFLTQLSMFCLFIGEIRRWQQERSGDKARPCTTSGKHFSECDCIECHSVLKKSGKASFDMSHVRSMETFVEAIPQWLLQVYIMFIEQSFPWYTIVSVAVSFISLIFAIFSLEKNYWIWKIVDSGQKCIKPVSFPKRSALVFFLWQTFLLLARLSAIILNIVVFTDSISVVIGAHWSIVVAGLVYIRKGACDERKNDDFCCRYLTISFLSLFIIYPLLFHVSHSSVACIKRFLPDRDTMVTATEAIAVATIPLLFMVAHCVGGVRAIKNDGKDELLVWYTVIGSSFVVACIFEAIFCWCCHPLKVTYRNWQKLQDISKAGRVNTNV